MSTPDSDKHLFSTSAATDNFEVSMTRLHQNNQSSILLYNLIDDSKSFKNYMVDVDGNR